MAEGKDSSLPIIMDHFEQSPSASVSQTSAQQLPQQDLPQAAKDALNIFVVEFLKIQRTNEELNKTVQILSEEVKDLKRRLQKEENEKESYKKSYLDIQQKWKEDARRKASASSLSNPVAQPRSSLSSPQLTSRSMLADFEEGGSLQSDGAVPKRFSNSLISDDYDGIIRKDEKFMQQELKSVTGADRGVAKFTIEEDAFSPDDDDGNVPEVKVTSDHLDFMASGLDTYNWQTYMRALGLLDSDLEDIKYNHRDNAYEQRYQALLFWRNKHGLNASPESLINAALRRNQRLLAEKFCQRFKGFNHLLKKDPDKKLKKSDSSLQVDAAPKSSASESEIAKSLSDMSISTPGGGSVSSFTEQEHYTTAVGDQAVPTTPVHSDLHKSSSCPPPQAQQTVPPSTLFVLIKDYMNNPDEGNRLLNEVYQALPLPHTRLSTFTKNLLKLHDEEGFSKMINASLPQCKNWLDVCECWAKAVTETDIVKWKDRPPIFLWNFFHALHTSGLTNLHKKIKKFLKPGSVGPSLLHTESLSEAKWSLVNDVGMGLLQQVPGAADWRKLAEELDCSSQIPVWEQKGDGGKNVLQVFKTRGKTVGDLYEVLFHMHRNDIVKCMEDLKYTLQLTDKS